MIPSCSCVECNDSGRCSPHISPLDSFFHKPEPLGSFKALSVGSLTRHIIVVAIMVLSASSVLVPVQGWANSPAHDPNSLNNFSKVKLDGSYKNLKLYLQPNGENSHNGPWVGQVFFNTERSRRNVLFHNSRRKRIYAPSHGKKQSLLKYSRSILTSTDTLPSFSTAHGLLSPETVARMDFMTRGSRSEPLEYFFQHYRRNGPMACLPFLSDMNVLPHLTEAMRDITRY